MKLVWKSENITDMVSRVAWSGSAQQAARTVEFEVAYSPNDKGFNTLGIKNGDEITFYPGYPDDKKTKFVGTITSRERVSEAGSMTYTAQDGMIHLLRSSGTFKFKNKTPEKIVQLVCKDIGISTGTLAKTKTNIKKIFFQERPYYEIIMAVYTKAKRKNGKKYIAQMNGAKLEVIEKGKIISDYTIREGVDITDSSYSFNTDNMVNRVYIYNNKNKKIGTVSNDKHIKQYGVFQNAITVDSGAGKAEAKQELHGNDRAASVSALGDHRCISGLGVKIKDMRTGLNGKYWIESDSHEWSDGAYTMTLDLQFKNIMDTQAGDTEEKADKGSGKVEVVGGTNKKSEAIQKVLNQAREWIGISGNTNAATKYYGMNGVAWCCIFQWSIFNKSGNGKYFMNGGKTARVYDVRDWYKRRGKTGKTPHVGDLVIYNWSHIGIVEKVKSKTSFTTIEGNTTGSVCKRRERTISQVSCFCYPDWPKGTTGARGDLKRYKGGKLKWPLPGYGTITGKYGTDRGDHIHAGIDIGTQGARGKKCVASFDGKIVKNVSLGSGGARGHYVDLDIGGGIVLRYQHLEPGTGLRVGAKVKQGQRVGTVGGSGYGRSNYYAVHLHFEVLKNYKNGQGTAVNPTAYL